MQNFAKIENDIISEIKLTPLQAKVFLLVTTGGQMSIPQISETLKIKIHEAEETAKKLQQMGAFIDISESEFEAMHPRFTAVNMYRKLCEREKLEFKQNKIVDNIGVVLERPYEEARTGKSKTLK